MASQFEDILIDRVGSDGRVARITLNRPEVLNALSSRLIGELEDALRLLETDDSARVIILRGAGRAFSAGWDFGGGNLHTNPHYADASYTTEDDEGRPQVFNFGLALRVGAEVQLKLWDVGKVTIVQAHGYCVAGGMELAMMADLITASDTCQFGHPGHRGLGVARNGMILPLVVGMRKAKELFYTGDAISGSEAERIGLINYAWPEAELDERTIQFADRIANSSGDYLGVLKTAANTFYENMGLRQSVSATTHLDATSQYTESGYEWHEKLSELGFKGAVAWRDGRYGDYGAANQ
jgi:enoyl-CoA hydratase